MNKKLVEEMTEASLSAKMSFAEIVGKLIAEGVESYRVDFIRKENTYYMPNGESHITYLHFKDYPIAESFNLEGIQSAIKASQRLELKFVDFIPRAMDAGVMGYIVFFKGKKVIYYGRKGDTHTELFPQTK
jgi:uncharacterized protein YbcV (DUF1398 family)